MNRWQVFSLFCLCSIVTLNAVAQESPSPAMTAARSVRISFVPPPLEGTISLGIYDSSGKLVRVLYREAEISDFDVGADALHTKWDGRSDSGEPLPAGKYSARGYVVGELQVDDPVVTNAALPPQGKLVVKLMPNALSPGKRQSVELQAGFDEDGTFLQTADGLPLFTIDETTGIFAVSVQQRGDKTLDFFQDDGDTVDAFHISGVDRMMAFDAGDFELK